MLLPMRPWLIIWALTGLALTGAARFLAPPTPEHYYLRLLAQVFPWAALWASLVAHAPLPSSLRRVHHVTIGAILVLLGVGFAAMIARDTGRLTPLSTRLFLLAGLGGGLFALFGTAWAISASLAWQRTRKAGVLSGYRPEKKSPPQPRAAPSSSDNPHLTAVAFPRS